MADLANPVDEGLTDLTTVRRRVVAAFMEDHRLTDIERATLAAFDAAVAPMRQYRAKEKAAAYWINGGDIESNYGKRRFAQAGVTLVPLAAPASPRVIRLPQRSDNDAA